MTVSLLNTRSSRRLAQDTVKDENLMENGVLYLTEIQICQENNVSDIEQQLDTFEVHLNLEGDRYHIS